MTILENLWYGNIRPVEGLLTDNMEYKNLLRLVEKPRKARSNFVPHEQAQLFEKYYNIVNEMNSVSETHTFNTVLLQYHFLLN